MKRKGIFEVIMGSYDGAENCKRVGLHLLNKFTKIIPPNQLGLYQGRILKFSVRGVGRLARGVGHFSPLTVTLLTRRRCEALRSRQASADCRTFLKFIF